MMDHVVSAGKEGNENVLRLQGHPVAVTEVPGKDSVPRYIETATGLWMTALFALHDTHGFSLSLSVGECVRRGLTPSISGFVIDAYLAGWSPDRIRAVVYEAFSDVPQAPAEWLLRAKRAHPRIFLAKGIDKLSG